MKVVFIENKHKTKFWECIAKELLHNGHEIFWIVQNKLFAPKTGENYVIPKPNKHNLNYNEKFKALEKKDRYCYIYGQNPMHYQYYYECINEMLTEIQPDYVFGESTLFHELLTIQCCKEKSIMYLNPSTCRYPNGRFSFYKYDTQEPYLGSKEAWSHEQVIKVIDDITTRKKQPDYMKSPSSFDKLNHMYRRSKGLLLSFISSEVLGEIYNTPLLKQKHKVERNRQFYYNDYEDLAITDVGGYEAENTLIFPLQMQPESNIDVWGFPYNSQSDLVKKLSSNLGEGWNILIKPNPKSKYEISEELINSIKECGNVYALKHEINMKELFDRFSFFFSITGTINHESILSSDKRCFSPSLPVTKIFTPNLAKIPTAKDISCTSIRPKNTPELLMTYLIATSYRGLIGDNIHTPQAFSIENVNLVSEAFFNILNRT